MSRTVVVIICTAILCAIGFTWWWVKNEHSWVELIDALLVTGFGGVIIGYLILVGARTSRHAHKFARVDLRVATLDPTSDTYARDQKRIAEARPVAFIFIVSGAVVVGGMMLVLAFLWIMNIQMPENHWTRYLFG